jgi:prepilin-type processing-associated H-X9-DG protein
MRARSAGFSYIELMVVTAIVGISYVMLLGPSSATGQSRSKAQCAERLRQLHQCLVLYAAEHEGAFPAVAGATTSEAPLSLLVPLYTTDTSLFICPGSKDGALPGAEPFANRRISYAYYMGLRKEAPHDTPLLSDAQATTGAKRSGEALFSPTGAAPGNKHGKYGGNVLFLDGSVEAFSPLASRDLAVPPGATLLNPRP